MIELEMRVGLAWWLVVALAGCRLGFDDVVRAPPLDGAPDGVALDAAGNDAPPVDAGTDVQLVVVSDEYDTDPIGTPIAGATVLIDRGGGFERMVTDAAGTARFAAAGVVACHVVLKTDLAQRVYTVTAPHAGTIELGGRPSPNLAGAITFNVPDDNAASYTIRVLAHCASPPTFGGTTNLTFSYDHRCEGQSGRTLAFSFPQVGPTIVPRYLDAGDVALVNGASLTLAGTYLPLPVHPVMVSQPPVGTSLLSTSILARAGLDLVELAPDADSVVPKPGTDVTTIATRAAPRGNTLSVVVSNTLPLQYSSISQITVPQAIADPIVFDGGALLPLFQSLVLTGPPRVAWTGSGDRGTILIVETIANGVQWDAYLDPAATSIDFPALPADLGVPGLDHFDFASVVKLDVPGATRDAVLRTIDRTWSLWPHDASLFPAAGGASARIIYSAGLGPP